MASEIVFLITEQRNKQRITLPAGSYRFGRSAQCEYVLRRNNVGEVQFVVACTKDGWTVTDSSTECATWYDNRYLNQGETCPLQEGDVLGLNTDGNASTQEITFRVEEIRTAQSGETGLRQEQTDNAVLREVDVRRKKRVLIGRGDDCDIKLVSDRVSRHHCEILYKDGHYELRDLGSTNGTYVDGARVTGTVLRIDPTTGDMFLRIGQGNDTSDAVLQAGEQIPGETHHEGDMIRVYVLEVHKMGRGPLIHVSRTHPNLVRRLFELETPEIADGQVEIRNIAREAGSRSKMAVRAAMEGIDPVGACVGPHGGRVGAVVKELGGEKIDIVVWSEDPCQYVRAALSPADVIDVSLIPGQKACRVIVPDDQLSLAIGKEGQNARLAARLTGYKIDIKPASQAEPAEETEEA